jgi:hypothetical protein
MGARVAPMSFFYTFFYVFSYFLTNYGILRAMLKRLNFFKYILEGQTVKTLLADAVEICDELASRQLRHLDIDGYCYTAQDAVDELGLDEALVNELIADYVAQIIRSVIQFESYLQTLRSAKEEKLNYTPFRELAHKNLGVARNLRIRDAQVLLYELMKKDDLDYLVLCLEALKACTVKLNPQCAYETIMLIYNK